MRFVIVTGVSGAGKTSALKMLEDAKYFCAVTVSFINRCDKMFYAIWIGYDKIMSNT